LLDTKLQRESVYLLRTILDYLIDSIATSWALFALAKNREIQVKLREELLTVDTYKPTMDQLNSLTYLDMVIKETMRMYPPFKANSRVSAKDDTLPLANPIIDRRGNLLSSIRWSSNRWHAFWYSPGLIVSKKGK